MPVHYLRHELFGSRGKTASGSPSIKMDYANPSQAHNTRAKDFAPLVYGYLPQSSLYFAAARRFCLTKRRRFDYLHTLNLQSAACRSTAGFSSSDQPTRIEGELHG
ncbi:hypothetical protein VU08_08385 [Desulfobulbus sp. F5]|nr:hypothetical protein [Desulfobulbus sp. F5]